ncbi:hypothetical protein AAFF27_16095 [Xylophilus sp. GW821-FHT01B05]
MRFRRGVKIESLSECGTADAFAIKWVWGGFADGPIRYSAPTPWSPPVMKQLGTVDA